MTPIELRARREALGLTQGFLAEALGVAQNTVSQWEHGRRGIPEGVEHDLSQLETTLEDAVEQFLDLGIEGKPLRVPATDGAPYAMLRVAAARARREVGAIDLPEIVPL